MSFLLLCSAFKKQEQEQEQEKVRSSRLFCLRYSESSDRFLIIRVNGSDHATNSRLDSEFLLVEIQLHQFLFLIPDFRFLFPAPAPVSCSSRKGSESLPQRLCLGS